MRGWEEEKARQKVKKKRIQIILEMTWTQEEINEYKKNKDDKLKTVYVWTKLKFTDKIRLLEKS